MRDRLPAGIRRLGGRILRRTGLLQERVPTWAGYTSDAMQLAQIIDCSPSNLLTRQQHPERVAPECASRICNWYLPQFDSPFYGGVMTILRLAAFLKKDGVAQRFLICGSADAQEMCQKIASAFPDLRNSEVVVLDSAHALQNIPPSDYSVATLWTTAYVLLGVHNTGLKFYMIQDFEPAFYPAGSTYAQAELTYRFGFYGICNTETLKGIYEREYGGRGVVLQPSIDKSVFHGRGRTASADVKRVFYYARPGTPRNGFELAAAALKMVKARLGEGVDIVCAGTGWSPAEFGLDGIVRVMGMLPYAATADLYRSCSVGFVMMMTKHPSYLPFELMACGTTVVTNYNSANSWLLRDGENCLLAPPSASCIAETLIYAIECEDQLGGVRARASAKLESGLLDWDQSLRQVADFVYAPPQEVVDGPAFGHSFLALSGQSF